MNCSHCGTSLSFYNYHLQWNSFTEVFHNTLILIASCTAVVVTVKMLERSWMFQNFKGLFTSQLNRFCSVLLFMLLHCGMTFLMRYMHAPRLGPFGGHLGHIFSTRHIHLNSKFPSCYHSAEPGPTPRILFSFACWVWLMCLRISLWWRLRARYASRCIV